MLPAPQQPTVPAARRSSEFLDRVGPRLAVSGCDNVGKSTQLRILGRRCTAQTVHGGALHDNEPRLQRAREQDFARWWFTDSNIEEFTDVLACAYLRRLDLAPGGRLLLFDRGIPMLHATLAATLTVRENLEDWPAARRAEELLARYASSLTAAEGAERGIALIHSTDPAEAADLALARESSYDRRYARFQQALARQFHELVRHGRFDTVIVVGDRSIMTVQQELRAALRAGGLPVPATQLPDIRVIALGGMSESGKSTVGDRLAAQHRYTRLKISYLLDQAADRHGIDDVYAQGSEVQAELLVDSLDRFSHAHPFHRRISIESLHRAGSTAALRSLLGDALSVVYLEAPAATRARRAVAGPADTACRDMVKASRGAHRIKESADVVIDNSGPLLSLFAQVDGLARDFGLGHGTPRVRHAAHLDLPDPLTGAVAELLEGLTGGVDPVDLIAVTGSGARGKYQHGWSDLDVLILADHGALPGVATAARRTRRRLPDVKVGLTVITAAECRTGWLTARVAQVLHQLGTGSLHGQWVRPGLRLPCAPAVENSVDLDDGPAAAIELRRQLLREDTDSKAVFKVAALLAKVILRLSGEQHPDDAAALTALARVHLPELTARMIIDAKTVPEVARTLATAVCGLWVGWAGGAAGARP